jgi:hypothetical protein
MIQATGSTNRPGEILVYIEPSVYIEIGENPNCSAMDGQVFQPRSAARLVSGARVERNGIESWFDITGLDAGGAQCPAQAYLIDDSGDGACWLVTGGEWGLRFRDPESDRAWGLADPAQWGAPYLMLPGEGSDLRFI